MNPLTLGVGILAGLTLGFVAVATLLMWSAAQAEADERPPWQDFVRVRAPDVAEATGLTAARVGVAIQRIVDEESDVDAPADIEFERAEPARAWEVREA